MFWSVRGSLPEIKFFVTRRGVKATERLHPSASPQLFSYLCATTLEVGLLLHFGREPRFYRVICENPLKRHASRRASER